MELLTQDSLLLLLAAFAAGLVDSIIGGGGLIQLPAMLFYLPNAEIATVLGTNKFASFSGTSVSAIGNTTKTEIKWTAVWPAILFALPSSFAGAFLISHLEKSTVKPIMLFLFLAVGLYTFFRKDFGLSQVAVQLSKKKEVVFSSITGIIIGFYDGFFGPGTGSFLVFLYVSFFGFNFLQSSACAKIVNVVTNLSALLYFYIDDKIIFSIAIPVAFANIVGSYLGTRLALKKGAGFVRVVFLFVVSALILKMAFDIFYFN